MGYPVSGRMGHPPNQEGWGTPHNGGQSENITFCHPSDVGGAVFPGRTQRNKFLIHLFTHTERLHLDTTRAK